MRVGMHEECTVHRKGFQYRGYTLRYSAEDMPSIQMVYTEEVHMALCCSSKAMEMFVCAYVHEWCMHT